MEKVKRQIRSRWRGYSKNPIQIFRGSLARGAGLTNVQPRLWRGEQRMKMAARGRSGWELQQVDELQSSLGFTLVEAVVTIAILSIITTIVLAAFPQVRDHQTLIAAEQQLRSYIRQAEQASFNQIRPEDCTNTLPEEDHGLCSDTGIAIRGSEVILFADTLQKDVNQYEQGDYVYNTLTLPSPARALAERTLLFEADPPGIILYVDGVNQSPGRVELMAGSRSKLLTIHRYGQVE